MKTIKSTIIKTPNGVKIRDDILVYNTDKHTPIEILDFTNQNQVNDIKNGLTTVGSLTIVPTDKGYTVKQKVMTSIEKAMIWNFKKAEKANIYIEWVKNYFGFLDKGEVMIFEDYIKLNSEGDLSLGNIDFEDLGENLSENNIKEEAGKMNIEEEILKDLLKDTKRIGRLNLIKQLEGDIKREGFFSRSGRMAELKMFFLKKRDRNEIDFLKEELPQERRDNLKEAFTSLNKEILLTLSTDDIDPESFKEYLKNINFDIGDYETTSNGLVTAFKNSYIKAYTK